MTPTIPRSPAAQAASYHPTALISGGSSGIGLELAKLFARDGYRLVLVAHNEAKLAAAAEQLRASYGVDVRTVSQDLSVAGAASPQAASANTSARHSTSAAILFFICDPPFDKKIAFCISANFKTNSVYAMPNLISSLKMNLLGQRLQNISYANSRQGVL